MTALWKFEFWYLGSKNHWNLMQFSPKHHKMSILWGSGRKIPEMSTCPNNGMQVSISPGKRVRFMKDHKLVLRHLRSYSDPLQKLATPQTLSFHNKAVRHHSRGWLPFWPLVVMPRNPSSSEFPDPKRRFGSFRNLPCDTSNFKVLNDQNIGHRT